MRTVFSKAFLVTSAAVCALYAGALRAQDAKALGSRKAQLISERSRRAPKTSLDRRSSIEFLQEPKCARPLISRAIERRAEFRGVVSARPVRLGYRTPRRRGPPTVDRTG